jgi:HSP20 family protein
MRFDPFRDFDRTTQAATQRVVPMPMDAYRKDDRFIVHFDIPGVDPESIDLTVEKNVLMIKAERKWEPPEDEERLVNERPQGVFTRQLFLGESLDADHIEASYEKGVLTLRIPVAEQAKPHKVEITAANGSATPIPASDNTRAGVTA